MPRPSHARLALAAVCAAAALGTGCEARGHSAAPVAPALTVVAPLATSAPLPQAPPDQPAATFDGLQARVNKAAADAAEAGADLTVAILDRNTGQLVSTGTPHTIAIASVVKLFIADDLLLQEADGETELSPQDRVMLDVMLRSSDDSAAEVFWNRSGGSAIVDRVVDRYGLTSTRAPGNGRWFNTISTVTDLVRYYDKLLAGTGGLPPERASIIMANLAQSTPTAPDGMVPGGVYPQRFGIPEGVPGEPVAVKQGWMCCVGADWMHLSTGVIGPDRRFVMAISSMQPVGDAAARQTITDAVRTIFPGGHL